MDFLLAQPAKLAPWVEAVWFSAGSLERRRERVLPTASTDIVANLGAPMRLLSGRGAERIVGTTVTGLLTRPIVLEHPLVHEAVGVRLSAHGLRAVLGVPTAAFIDQVVELELAVDSAVDELVQACSRVTSPAARLDAAIDWLARRLDRCAGGGDALVVWASECIETSLGRVPIARLQRESGFSATRFNQRFRDQLGVTPKRYARLVRFRAALDRLDPSISLADLAHGLGYADQAHMNRDFRSLAGCSPTAVIRNSYVSGLTIAE
ncbi:MAG: helix-turn-helix domain-containing protein [Acidobacteriota bacterium]